MPSPSRGDLAYDDLERRFDGPIPPRLIDGSTEHDLRIGHHRVMIRFSETRIVDFTQSLARLQAAPVSPETTTWIAATHRIIADHQSEKQRHERALFELLAPERSHTLSHPRA